MGKTKLGHHPQPPKTIHHQSKCIHHYPPLPENRPPPRKSQNVFIHDLLLTLFEQFLFLRNATFLYVTEVLCDKVLISSFFKFKISTTFYDISEFLKFIFQELKIIRFIFVCFDKKDAEAVAQRCSVGKVFLETFQYSQENTCATVYFLIRLQD